MRASIAHLQRIKVGKAQKCLDHGINIRPMEINRYTNQVMDRATNKPNDKTIDRATNQPNIRSTDVRTDRA